MRPFFVVASALIVPFVAIHFLAMITGDPLSAVFLALIIFVTLAAWFGTSAASGRIVRRG